MKIILISILIVFLLVSCCSVLPPEKTVQTDSVYIERIVKDTIYLEDAPEIKVTDNSKTFTVNPFEAVTDTIISNANKKTHVKAKFIMKQNDSANFDIKISDITGNTSMTMSKIRTITLNHIIKEKIKWYEYIIWVCVGFVLGVFTILFVRR